jgi:chromosomal replication initiator protein
MTIGLDPALGFGGLVLGASNQLAVSAARAMAESAQPPFNPLVIFGGEGLGKTHLLHAMGHLRLDVEPRAIVRLVSWTELLEGWRAAKAADRTREYLVSFAECGLLLIDDIHRLLDRAEGRTELLGLLEHRIEARRSTVLASRRVPTDLVQANDPAARVVGQGLVVELNPPDPAMRWEILSRRCSEAGMELSQPVLEEIAALPLSRP